MEKDMIESGDIGCMRPGVDEAVEIAVMQLKGLRDLAGNPDLLHAMAVGLAGRTEEEQVVGFLHDVVEDTDWTFEMFEERGFSKRVVDALRLLTHDTGKMSYMQYIDSICRSGNELAINVKVNDLKHNIWRAEQSGLNKYWVMHYDALRYIERTLGKDFHRAG